MTFIKTFKEPLYFQDSEQLFFHNVAATQKNLSLLVLVAETFFFKICMSIETKVLVTF